VSRSPGPPVLDPTPNGLALTLSLPKGVPSRRTRAPVFKWLSKPALMQEDDIAGRSSRLLAATRLDAAIRLDCLDAPGGL
jgi:hypothetical protein